MKIFLAIKVPRGDAERESIITTLSKIIRNAGHLPFVATKEIAKAGLTSPSEFMPFVRQHLADTDLFLLIYHPELRGGLIEAGIAYQRGIPIWVCHKVKEKVSSSMLGCAETIIAYHGIDDLNKKISRQIR